MIAAGSIEGREKRRSRVATNLTQSVEPGSGTRSTLIPALANQPSFVAIAKGEPAEVIVLEHHPTRIVLSSPWAKADAAEAKATPATSETAAVKIFIIPLPSAVSGFAIPAAVTVPKKGRGA